MIDLHCHVLPGIDDGPTDVASAIAMVLAYEADGVETVVATPHLRADFPEVVPADVGALCAALEGAAAVEGSSVQIVPGGEIDLTWALTASDDDLCAVSLDGLGCDLLVETPANPLAPGVAEALFAVALRGYRITLSHPELSPSFQQAPGRLADLVARGILLQVTAGALLRPARRSPSAALGQDLVRERLCAALAGDAHSAGPWRPPELAHATVAAARLTDPAYAEWLVLDAPDAILAGEPLPAPRTTAPTPRGRAWLRRRASV